MGIIYGITVALWAFIMIAFSFSDNAQYVSNRVFNLIIILTIIPVLNTVLLLSSLYTALIDNRTREERTECLKVNSEHLDIVIQDIINKIKNNG